MVSKLRINRINTLAIAAAMSLSFLSFSACADESDSNSSIRSLQIAYAVDPSAPNQTWGQATCYNNTWDQPETTVGQSKAGRTDNPNNYQLITLTPDVTTVSCQIAPSTDTNYFAVFVYHKHGWTLNTNPNVMSVCKSTALATQCTLVNKGVPPTTASIGSAKLAFAHTDSSANSNKLHKSHA